MLFDKKTTIRKLDKYSTLYTRYNKSKIDYLSSYIPEKKREVFELIPFLLHEEDPDPSGKEFDGCPLAGISNFSYTPELKAFIKRYFPNFTIQPEAKRKLPISFLALMGSIGTVAFTKESDMDFWVGVDATSGDVDLFSLEERFRNIEKWTYETARLETHFFIADLNKIRREDYGTLSEESCGSTLGKLLKDEFYRTAIIVQGKMPFYWLMPPGISDTVYNKKIDMLCADSSFSYYSFIDLGNVHHINRGEYFGAALWQLFKGLHNPFKSVMKMAVLDKYSAAGDKAIPLCEEYKNEVFTSQSPGMSDSFLFMIESLRTFYTGQNQVSIRKIIEECFLIRNLLSFEDAQMEDKARTQLFYHIGERWGWKRRQIDDFANFRDWDFAKREALKKRVIGFLVDTYNGIRERTKDSKAVISDRDLTIIGKKLKSILEPRERKIPYEYSLFMAKDVSLIEIDNVGTAKKSRDWQVEIWIKGAKSDYPQILRRVYNPVVACAWCSMNGFYKGKEKVKVSKKSSLTSTEIINLINTCNNFFPSDEADKLKIKDLLDKLYITHLYVMPNWEDPDFNSSVDSLVVFYKNNIGEMFYNIYKGKNWEYWLIKDVFEKAIGVQQVTNLTWAVHIFKGNTTSTRRVSGIVSHFIKEYIEEAGR